MTPTELEEFKLMCSALRGRFGLASLVIVGIEENMRVAIACDIAQHLQDYIPDLMASVADQISENMPLCEEGHESRVN